MASGIAMMYPGIIIPEFVGASGIFLTDLAHIISGFIISIFLLVHLYFCTFGTTATSNFKSMVSGYHE
jgi:thiosulfate reductase cytochrome b subunit